MDENTQLLPAGYLKEITSLLDQLDARHKQVFEIVSNREQLGDFTSVVCFKALMTGLEDILGEQASRTLFVRAGRIRGQQLVADWGIEHLQLTPKTIQELLDAALGKKGTRLCCVQTVELFDAGIIVNTTDTICSAAEEAGSHRRCTFTLGAVWGAIETITQEEFNAQQTQSVLAGDRFDQFVFFRRSSLHHNSISMQ